MISGAYVASVLRAVRAVVVLFAATTGIAQAQQVTPLLAEYRGSAAGSFEVENTSLVPQVVMLEPKSFSIDPNGNGQFRPLDEFIHLELSASSVRLEPRGRTRIFYKVDADRAPVWLCIYASFRAARKNAGLDVRVMLPHTVYLYGKEQLDRDAVQVDAVHYDRATHKVLCRLHNTSDRAGRASLVEVTGEHAAEQQGGFPLLPHAEREITVDWPSEHRPREFRVAFERFTVKAPVPANEE